jgi:protein-S-isoprenylcysteine O-methyltransferase Ste14
MHKNGADVQPVVSAQPAAKVIFAAALVLFMVVQLRVAGAGLLGRITRRKVGVVRLDRGSLLLVTAMTGVGIVGAFLFAAKVHSAAIAGGNAFIQWLCLAVGAIAIVCGSLGRQWAISTLGRFFTLNVQVSADQRVVTDGPYRWVRHPSYTADLLAFTGIGLALGNWLSLLAAATLPLLGLLVRIRVEEAALLTSLGEPYRAFAAGKKRLLPRVW